ncbi:MAG: ribonuclease HII [Patescibacteria group bacterium]
MKFPTLEEEKKLWRAGYKYVAGLDEAGRGALAGPIFAAAVIFNKGVKISGVNDSKKLTPEKREELYKIITKNALFWSIASLSHQKIDKIGIGRANLEVMEKAIKYLKHKPDFLLIDAHKLETKIPSFSIIKGDEKVFSIAAASILAKVSRDRFMIRQGNKYSAFQFEINKGYGTGRHLAAIRKHGPCLIHRRSFKPLKKII